MNYRRRSNPDIYPGARRFSTSYSDEDILSNDQLDQIHFDPRYRDYRSASSLNNSNYRSRSNSLHSTASSGHMAPQYQHFRRVSSPSPPLIPAPLIPQKRWDTNPSIFIEEYRDEEPKSDAKSDEKNSRETLCTSNDSLQPALSVNDIKSFGDLSQIPFIDDDDTAPCRILSSESNNELTKKTDDINAKTCRKTVSFDMIKSGPSYQRLYTSNGNNFPKNFSHSNFYSTDKNSLFHASQNPSLSSCRTMSNVRTSRDGYVARPRPSQQSVPMSSFSCHNSDHCTLVNKLMRIKMEEKQKCDQHVKKNSLNYKIKWDDDVGAKTGKVKALTTYFNSLPYMSDECNCVNIKHQSTPNLSMTKNNDKLTCEEMTIVRNQLKEWSEFGLKNPSKDTLVCTFMKRATSSPSLCLENEIYNDCKQFHDVLNRLDKVKMKRMKRQHQHNLSLHSNACDYEYMKNPHLPDCFILKKANHCYPKCDNIDDNFICPPIQPQPPSRQYSSEKHKCRSACYNIKDPAKKLLKKKRKQMMNIKTLSQQHQKHADEDNESLII